MGICGSTLPEVIDNNGSNQEANNNNSSTMDNSNINNTEFRTKFKLDDSLEMTNKYENGSDSSYDLNNIIVTADKYKYIQKCMFEVQPGKCNNKCFYKRKEGIDQYLYYVKYVNSDSGRWQIASCPYSPPSADDYIKYDTSTNEYKLHRIKNNNPLIFVNSNQDQPFLVKNDKQCQWLLKTKTDFILLNVDINQELLDQLPQTKIYDNKLTVVNRSIFHLSSHIVHEYESIELEENSTLTTREWKNKYEIGGKLFIKSRSDVVLHENAKIITSGLGYIYNDQENENDLTMMKLGKGGGSYYDQHDNSNDICTTDHNGNRYHHDNRPRSGRGGGTIYIQCNRLVMKSNAIIETNGFSGKYASNNGEGGSIYIIAKYISMQSAAKIEALSGSRYANGRIEIEVSFFTLIDGFIRQNGIGLHVPMEVIKLIVKFWSFDFKRNKIAISPNPRVVFK